MANYLPPPFLVSVGKYFSIAVMSPSASKNRSLASLGKKGLLGVNTPLSSSVKNDLF